MVPRYKEIDAEEATVLDALGVEVLYRYSDVVKYLTWVHYPNYSPLKAQLRYNAYTFYVRN